MTKWLCLATLLLVECCAVKGTEYRIKGIECWTRWFDMDDPTTDDGDFELITNVQPKSDVCTKRIEIEVQTVGGVTANSTGQIFLKNDVVEGFTCLNSNQLKNMTCLDYRIRFKCPPAFCRKPQCWTDWFDRDDPSGSGDWETTADLHKEYPAELCVAPLDIEVRTVEGLTVASTKDKLTISKGKGAVCKVSENPQGCHDWKVRFLCPHDFCFKKECWTKWFERGSPTALVSWGVLAAVKSNSTDNYCPEMLLTEIKAMVQDGTSPKSNVYDDKGIFLANLYQNSDLIYEVRYMCNIGFCRSTDTDFL